MNKNFRTYELAVAFYKDSKTLPLVGTVRRQFERASLSIVLNLAEGRGKSTKKEQVRFFDIAMGSLRECQAVLQIEELQESSSYRELDTIGAHLYKLIKNAI